jgi:apolipoprotein N-acyltransferase
VRAGRTRRFRIAAAVAGLSTTFFVLALFVPDWIEVAFRVDPDRHSSSLEWALVALPLAVAVAAGAVARLEWMKSRTLAERLAPSELH